MTKSSFNGEEYTSCECTKVHIVYKEDSDKQSATFVLMQYASNWQNWYEQCACAALWPLQAERSGRY